MELGVFSHQRNRGLPAAALDPFYHLFPIHQITGSGCGFQGKLPQGNAGKPCLLQHQRGLIKAGNIAVFNDAVFFHIAEQSDFPVYFRLHRPAAPGDDQIRRDAEGLELLDRVLSRLGFVFAGRFQIRDQGYVDKQTVFPSDFMADLADGFQKRLGLHVASGAADLRDHDVGAGFFLNRIDEVFDLIGNMGNHLDRLAQVFSAPFLI